MFSLLYAFLMPIQETPFTVFDIETTGLAPSAGDRIVEIAGVRIERGEMQPSSQFLSLVNPQRKVPWEAQSVNRITEEDLLRAPTIDAVLPQFLEFARGTILVAHNAEFDLSFLCAEKEMCWGYIDIPESLCTLCLSRSLSPHEYRHNLDAVAERLGVPLPAAGRHRALPDVLVTAEVFLKLLHKGNISSLEDLRKRATPVSGNRAKSKLVSWRSA